MKKDPIAKTLMNAWEVSRSATSKYEEIINDRIDYILRFWFEAFGGKLNYWWFEGADEGEVGDLYRHMNKTSINEIWVDCVNNSKEDMIILDKNGLEYEWQNEIPTRWLYEDFESEIIKGKQDFINRELERKNKKKELSAKQKAEDEALAQAAKSKLSKKELAALRRTL